MDEAGGRIVKMEVDYSNTVDEVLPECQELAKEGKYDEALEKLLTLEKQTRLAVDALSTGRVLKAVVRMFFDLQKWEMLNEHIVLLTKRRSQLKTAVASMVEECCKFVDQTPDIDTKKKLIDTLRTVSEGKIYVEVPRARLTMELAKMKEAEGLVSEAADVLQELQVETYGSMEKEEKVFFIIEQMRLCLARKDYIRAQIISKKISTKFFFSESDNIQDLKLQYYQLMIELCHYEKKYLAICQHYRAIFDTPKVKEDVPAWKEALKNSVLYVLLSPYDNEQSDLLHRVFDEKRLDEIPVYKSLITLFRRQEIISWDDLSNTYSTTLRSGTDEDPATGVFTIGLDEGEERWLDFKKRVVEHNIRVISQYYTKISLSRLAELLALDEMTAEGFLSDLVTKKTVFARINRPSGVISFTQSKDPVEVLNDWSHNLSSLMMLVSKTTHLINKEEMVHRLVK